MTKLPKYLVRIFTETFSEERRSDWRSRKPRITLKSSITAQDAVAGILLEKFTRRTVDGWSYARLWESKKLTRITTFLPISATAS